MAEQEGLDVEHFHGAADKRLVLDLGQAFDEPVVIVEAELGESAGRGLGGDAVEDVGPEFVGNFLRLLDTPKKCCGVVGGVERREFRGLKFPQVGGAAVRLQDDVGEAASAVR